MSLQFKNLYRMLCMAVAVQAAQASDGAGHQVNPSDCKARDADSTCATAVAGAPVAAPPPALPEAPLYKGPLGGVPASGYAYWGFDFIADLTGTPSPVRPDEFINRSKVPVTITLTFDFPTSHGCHKDCMPGVQFQAGPGWAKIDPPYVIDGNTVSLSQSFAPGQGYGWVIALWQSTNPRLTVTVPANARASLQDVGIADDPAIATEIAAVPDVCTCWDASSVACSLGSRYSNGLLGPWSQNFTTYMRAGAFNDCPPER